MSEDDLGFLIGAIVGAIVGGAVAIVVVQRWSVKIRAHNCPRCTQPLLKKKPGPRTWTQLMWGGWTCPECNCDVDRFGKERQPT